MKYKKVKEYYGSGKLRRRYFVDENGKKCGEVRSLHGNGQSCCCQFSLNGYDYGEAKEFDHDGTILHHYLMDGRGNALADVINCGKPSTHSEEQLIEIAKEHNLPLLSEIPKTEAEVTLWNLKYPDCPCLPIESK